MEDFPQIFPSLIFKLNQRELNLNLISGQFLIGYKAKFIISCQLTVFIFTERPSLTVIAVSLLGKQLKTLQQIFAIQNSISISCSVELFSKF